MSQTQYNLDIHMYSLQELLSLFDLDYSITLEDMKRAKKKVLMTHPDKSKLGPEYFLFYKKAFDMVVKFYENQNKQNQTVTNEKRIYDANHQSASSETIRAVSKNIESMDKQKFNDTFNKLFDKNMVQKKNPERNKWFTNEDAIYENSETVNTQNMGHMFDNFERLRSKFLEHGKCVSTFSKMFFDPGEHLIEVCSFCLLEFFKVFERAVHKVIAITQSCS